MICIALLSLKHCLHVPVLAKVYISPLIAEHCLHIQFWPRVIQLAPGSKSFLVSSFRRDSVDSLSLNLKNSSPTSYEIAGIRSHVFLSSSSLTSYIYICIYNLPGYNRLCSKVFKRQPFRRLQLTANNSHLLCGSSRILNDTKRQAQIDCNCLVSALRILEDLETKNYNLQEYSGLAISQRLSESLVQSVEVLSCKRCSKIFSEAQGSGEVQKNWSIPSQHDQW